MPHTFKIGGRRIECLEASALVYQGVLELSKKVAELRLNQQSHDTHDSTYEATKYIAKPSTSKGIGFKKKDGKKMKKNKRLKSWVDDLKQKRRKVKPLQPSMHKSSQVSVEASSSAPSLAQAHLPPFASHSSQISLGESTSNPPRAYSHVMPFASLPNQMSFTTMLMAQDDYSFPPLEAFDLSQPISDGTSLANREEALSEINTSHG
ncbi:c6 zinc finger domain protein [Sesbania bispinosa]|nr:c6 zinc finger domain protein [Sesbania bispinosa]